VVCSIAGDWILDGDAQLWAGKMAGLWMDSASGRSYGWACYVGTVLYCFSFKCRQRGCSVKHCFVFCGARNVYCFRWWAVSALYFVWWCLLLLDVQWSAVQSQPSQAKVLTDDSVTSFPSLRIVITRACFHTWWSGGCGQPDWWSVPGGKPLAGEDAWRPCSGYRSGLEPCCPWDPDGFMNLVRVG
jgi:hypothetical protein